MSRLRRFLLGCLVLLPVWVGVGLAAAAEQAPPPNSVSAFEYFFEKKHPQPAAPAAASPAPAPAAATASAVPAAPTVEPKPEGAVEMATYYLVLLRRGPTWTAEETPALAKLQEAHMANIRRLAQAGSLVLAGPFLEQTGPGSLSGLFLFRAGSREEVKALTDTDPMVQSGRLVPEILPWLGPKTLHY